MTKPLTLVGAYGSPYSMKMRAVLRYRRIPFTWILRGSEWDVGLPAPPVDLIPVLVFPNGEAMIDSSPEIDQLETMHHERSVTPVDPAIAFVDRLVEDYADEWLTKAMYHYRWHFPAAEDLASRLLPLDRRLDYPDAEHAAVAAAVRRRQESRRPLVGSTPDNAPVIETSYRRLLEILEAHLHSRSFIFGKRPARADFALFGQLSQLVHWERPSAEIAEAIAPRVIAWCRRIDDLSWLAPTDDDWASAPPAGLLTEIGRTYAPFLIANDRALREQRPEAECEIDGRAYRQAPFKYQQKCLGWLRDRYTGLDRSTRERVDALLAGSGAEALFA